MYYITKNNCFPVYSIIESEHWRSDRVLFLDMSKGYCKLPGQCLAAGPQVCHTCGCTHPHFQIP